MGIESSTMLGRSRMIESVLVVLTAGRWVAGRFEC
jgi:hypothetical protein